MQVYEDLDAFRVCHDLTGTTHRVIERFEERDPELAAQMWSAVLIATSRIVRATAISNDRMRVLCIDRTLGALGEFHYHLTIARAIDLITQQEAHELESLRGRAVFYTSKLWLSMLDSAELDGTEGAS